MLCLFHCLDLPFSHILGAKTCLQIVDPFGLYVFNLFNLQSDQYLQNISRPIANLGESPKNCEHVSPNFGIPHFVQVRVIPKGPSARTSTKGYQQL